MEGKVQSAASAVLNMAFLGDFIAITVLWFACMPMAKLSYKANKFLRRKAHINAHTFEESLSLTVAKTVRALAKVLGILYAFDIALLVLEAFNIPVRPDAPALLATLCKPIWLAYLVSKVKTWALGVSEGQLEAAKAKDAPPSGRRVVLNRLADFGLGILAAIVALGTPAPAPAP